MDWVFKGIDALSGPARSAVASLRALKSALVDVRRESGTGRFQASYLSLFRRQMKSLRRELGESSLGLQSFASGAMSVASSLGSGAFALGSNIVELAAFQQSAETSLAASMGDATQAAQAYREAIQIANQTPLDTREVIGAMQSLAAAGFRTLPTMRPLLGILTDIGSLHGSDAMSRFSLALGQVQARGALTMEELNQLREAAPSIAQPLMQALQASMGLSGPDAGQQLLRAISARRVSAQALVNALGAAGATMNASTGGALGGIARAQSQTLVGSLSNAKNAWENLILSFGTGQNAIANTPGLRQFRGFIDSITDSLDTNSARGQRAMAVLRPLIDGVFGTLFRGSPGTSVIDAVIEGVHEATPAIVALVGGVRDFTDGLGSGFMEAMGPALELLQQLSTDGSEGGNTMRSLGQAVGFLAGAFVMGMGVLTFAASGIAQIFTELPADLAFMWESITTWFSTVPTALVDGFLGTMRTEWGRLIGQVEGLAQQLPASVRTVLGIHSPSRVFAEIGLHTAEGMTEGVTAGTGDVQRAFEVMAAPSAERPALGAGGASMPSVNLVVNIDGRGRSDDELVDEFRVTVEDIFADIFERAALAVG